MTVTMRMIENKAREVGLALAEAGTHLDLLPVVGLKEIAMMFNMAATTPYQLRVRKERESRLPEEDDTISGNPVWKLPTIYGWAQATGRTIVWDPWGLYAPAEPVPAAPVPPPAKPRKKAAEAGPVDVSVQDKTAGM